MGRLAQGFSFLRVPRWPSAQEVLMIEHLGVHRGTALQLFLGGRPKGLSGRGLARARYFTPWLPYAATLPTVFRYMNWEGLDAKRGVRAEELLVGTPKSLEGLP